MNVVTTFAAYIEAFSIRFPWLMLFVMVALQATVVVAVAASLSRFCKRDSAWKHRLWTAVVMILFLVPVLHFGYAGWTYSVVSKRDQNRTELNRQTAATVEQTLSMDDQPAIDEEEQVSVANESILDREFALNSTHLDTSTHAVERFSQPSEVASERSLVAYQRYLNSIDVQSAIIAFYLIGFCISMLRLVAGTRWLSRIYREGTRLQDVTLELATAVASQIGLRQTPEVRCSSRISLPLVFGVFRSVVLVPEDFATWPQGQRRSALLHELTHIKRCDVIVELLTRVSRAIYWFHPAVWYVARQVTVTRELATDQAVVRYGEDPCQYATGLVDVFARLNKNSKTLIHVHSGVAMSRITTLEGRVLGILQAKQSIVSSFRGKLLLLAIMLVAAFTTVQLEFSQAADEPEASNKSQINNEGLASNYISEILPTDNDLFNRLRDCEVLNVEGDDYEAEFFVTGQVLDQRGKPVPDAIVVIRESSTSRISAKPQIYLETDQRDLIRTKDVFGKVTTDAEGKFVIDGAKAPAMPEFWSNSWSGSIVAGHPKLGIGWVSLGSSLQRQRRESGMSIVLQETTSIEGRYLTPEGMPLNDQSIRLLGLKLPKATFTNMGRNGLDLQASQLTPMLNTSDDGRILFTNLPKGFVATILAEDSVQWMGSSAMVATSKDIELGPQVDWNQRPTQETFVGIPFLLMADPGIKIEGTVVDPAGNPVVKTKVALSSSVFGVHSDVNGNFQLRLRSQTLDWLGEPVKFLLQPEQDDLLNSYQDVPKGVITANQPITFKLKRGVKVSGRVITKDGKPAANIGIMLQDPWQAFKAEKTDQDGNYTVYLPPDKHTLYWYDSEGNYQLPTYFEIPRGRGSSDVDLPKLTIDLIAGEEKTIEPFVVEPIEKTQLKLLVAFPDGEPAAGASVVVFEAKNDTRERPRVKLTDSAGRLDIPFDSAKLEDAVIEARLATSTDSYSGSLTIENPAASEQIIQLTRDWLLRGRVVVNGEGVAGAVVRAYGENVEAGPRNGVISYRMSNYQIATTGPDGHYEFRVRANQTYSVMLQYVPGIEEIPSVNPGPQRVGDGIYKIRDYEFKTGSKEISGIVVDLEGKPIENARVQVMPGRNADPARWQGHRETSQFDTDSEGRFVLRQIPKGSYQLWLLSSANGNSANMTLLKAVAGDRDLRLVIDRELPPELPTLQTKEILDLYKQTSHNLLAENTGTKNESVSNRSSDAVIIRGRLVGIAGEPITGASLKCVTITNKDQRQYQTYPSVSRSAETDEAGYFTAEVTDKTLQITWICSAAGYTTQHIDMPVTKFKDFEAKLDRAAAIEGRLIQAGKPLSNVKVGLVEEDRSYPRVSFPRELTTDENGVFRFDDLLANEKYVVYTFMGEETEGVLPESLVTAPGSGELAQLGDLETQVPQTITVLIQMLDGQPFPENSFIYFGRRRAAQGLRLPLDASRKGEATVTLSGVGRELIGLQPQIPGYETIRSIPNIVPDMSRTYQLNTGQATNISLFLQPEAK